MDSVTTMGVPRFEFAEPIRFLSFKTGLPQFLKKASWIDSSPANLQRLLEICNEPLVYDFLFRVKLAGAPYDTSMARDFLEWARKGWDNQTHFVFLVTDAEGKINAALDIKSNQLDDAEIGYWCSSSASGMMSNAVGVLCELARAAGYRRLQGLTLPQNERSAAVLRRNGFSDQGAVVTRGKEYVGFFRKL